MKKRDYFLGLFYVMLVIVLWVTSGVLAKWKFQTDFRSPFLVTYYTTCMLSIYLVAYLPFLYIKCTGCISRSDSGRSGIHTKFPEGSSGSLLSAECLAMDTVDIPDGAICPDSITHNKKRRSSTQSSEGATCCFCCVIEQSVTKLPLIEMVKLSGILGFLIFGMNWLNTSSVKYTSQGSSTVLSTFSGPFYLVLSNIFLKEPVDCNNVLGLVLVLVGSILIWYQDAGKDNDESDPTLGNAMAVISAFLYACYSTLMKLLIKDDSKVSTVLFLGLVGLWIALCLWPLFFLFDYIGFEHIGMLDWNKIGFLTLIGVIDILGDYFMARSILLISPIVVSVGLCFDVPFSLAADYFIFHKPMPFLYILGAVWLFFGFVMVNLAQKKRIDVKCNLTEELLGDGEKI